MRVVSVLVAMLALSGCYENKMRDQFAAMGCTPAGMEWLKDQPKVYCGKSCFRYKIREHFICGTGRAHFDH